jgi:hypothetical protein
VTGLFEVRAQPCGGLRIDCQGIAPATFARHAKRVIAAVLVQVANLERGNLRAAQADLQTDAEDRAIAQATGIQRGHARARFEQPR